MSTDSRAAESLHSDVTAESSAVAAGDVETTDEAFDADEVLYEHQVVPQRGILGLTLRELLIVGLWLVAFVTSFFPVYRASSASIWGNGISWIVPIGIPTVAVFLIVLRRFSPQGIRRVGSLGIDQFASVAFSFAALFWAQYSWDVAAASFATRTVLPLWVNWVQLIMMLGLVVVTVFAPLIPALAEDFRGRLATLSHRSANPVRPVLATPKKRTASAPADTSSLEEEDSSRTPTVQTEDARLTGASMPAVMDVELSGAQTTDQLSREEFAAHIPLSSHASGGGTGTSAAGEQDNYVPQYARRSRTKDETLGERDHLDASAESPASASEHPEFDSHEADDLSSIEHVSEEERSEQEAPGEYSNGEAVSAPNKTAETEVLDSVSSLAELFETGPMPAPSPDSPSEQDVDSTAPRSGEPSAQPFWALAPTERDVMDERGNPLFQIGPTAWALVLEDRGGAFVVRHDDGRIGYLHDISDITKG